MRWEPRANPLRDGKRRGVAYTHYKNNETLLAMGMDVEVDAKDRRHSRVARRMRP
jgi:hypothetical protein